MSMTWQQRRAKNPELFKVWERERKRAYRARIGAERVREAQQEYLRRKRAEDPEAFKAWERNRKRAYRARLFCPTGSVSG